tara:strand:+ start:2783 stop:3034 length:252 start_codon:yes stop_codon:yes gene_type:complete
MKKRTKFGSWLFLQLERYKITMMNLSDYSGIHIRTLYRLTNGDVPIKLEDWSWIIECIADMSDQDFNTLIDDCINKTAKKKIE